MFSLKSVTFQGPSVASVGPQVVGSYLRLGAHPGMCRYVVNDRRLVEYQSKA